MTLPDVIEFKERLLQFMKSTNKTSWGKNEVTAMITTQYVRYLEEKLDMTMEELRTRIDAA